MNIGPPNYRSSGAPASNASMLFADRGIGVGVPTRFINVVFVTFAIFRFAERLNVVWNSHVYGAF